MKPQTSTKYPVLYYCTILVVVTVSAAGQAGRLDNTFGNGGIATQQMVVAQPTDFYSVGGAAIQSDGKIVIVGGVPSGSGFTVPAVLHFLPTGSLDRTFAANGIFVLPGSFGSYAAVAIQSDGRILAGTGGGGVNGEVDLSWLSGKWRGDVRR
jgi:hypothetical protein